MNDGSDPWRPRPGAAQWLKPTCTDETMTSRPHWRNWPLRQWTNVSWTRDVSSGMWQQQQYHIASTLATTHSHSHWLASMMKQEHLSAHTVFCLICSLIIHYSFRKSSNRTNFAYNEYKIQANHNVIYSNEYMHTVWLTKPVLGSANHKA